MRSNLSVPVRDFCAHGKEPREGKMEASVPPPKCLWVSGVKLRLERTRAGSNVAAVRSSFFCGALSPGLRHLLRLTNVRRVLCFDWLRSVLGEGR